MRDFTIGGATKKPTTANNATSAVPATRSFFQRGIAANGNMSESG
jgi:hypothetical protein